MLDQGHSLTAVAGKIGCARSSVVRWRNLMNEKGNDVFNVLLPRGRPSRLNAKQIRKLERILLKGRLACGYKSYLWTTQQIADVIEREFGVPYNRENIGRVRKNLGWGHQTRNPIAGVRRGDRAAVVVALHRISDPQTRCGWNLRIVRRPRAFRGTSCVRPSASKG